LARKHLAYHKDDKKCQIGNAVPQACGSIQDLGGSTSVNETEKFVAKVSGRNDARERAATLPLHPTVDIMVM